MKFGIMNLFPLAGSQDDRQVINDSLEEAVLADEFGFDSFWLAEHHFSGYGILGNPLVFAGAIAQRTKRITIGTAVMVIPFYNPMRLAEDAALVDVLSNGRLVLGCGRGYQPKEFAGFGIDPKTSIDRYNETIDLLRLAWTKDNWSYHGKHFQYDDMTVYPRPVRGEVPILHAAVSPDSFERLGRGGEKIITSPNFTPLRIMKNNFELYGRALRDSGHDPSSYERPYMQQTWCGPDEAGRREAAEAAHRYYKMVGHVLPGAQKGLVDDDERQLAYYAKVKKGIDLLTVEQALTHGGNFGSEQQVVDTLHVLQEELGVTHYICWFRIPTLDRSRALKSMETFASRVIPQLRDPAPKRVAALN
jgi:alkanesulfonate monooxygenase SsuD/methylene tetrahydromethanopterin reductase-like flavin-dependent oxidoreductase (luciferase family)